MTSSDYIPIDELIPGECYLLESDHFVNGLWDGEKFYGLDEMTYRMTTDTPVEEGGTAYPLRQLVPFSEEFV